MQHWEGPLQFSGQVDARDHSIVFSALQVKEVGLAENTKIHAKQLDCSIQSKS